MVPVYKRLSIIFPHQHVHTDVDFRVEMLPQSVGRWIIRRQALAQENWSRVHSAVAALVRDSSEVVYM